MVRTGSERLGMRIRGEDANCSSGDVSLRRMALLMYPATGGEFGGCARDRERRLSLRVRKFAKRSRTLSLGPPGEETGERWRAEESSSLD